MKHFESKMKKTYRNPIPTVDIIIEINNQILLIKRKNPPYGWALPGGFIEYGESAVKAAIREAREETNIKINRLRQFKTYSNPHRDPRHHTISIVFIAEGKGNPKPATDAEEVKPFNLNNLPEELAFDHDKILRDYAKFKENKMET